MISEGLRLIPLPFFTFHVVLCVTIKPDDMMYGCIDDE